MILAMAGRRRCAMALASLGAGALAASAPGCSVLVGWNGISGGCREPCADGGSLPDSGVCTSPPIIANDPGSGRVTVENDLLRVEFRYAPSGNDGGGNLYRYVDKRYDAGASVVSINGSGDNAPAVGGIGGTFVFAAETLPDGGNVHDVFVGDFLDQGAVSVAAPTAIAAPDGTVVVTFQLRVQNPAVTPPVAWYEIVKTWQVACGGRIALRHEWRIVRDGYFTEPATAQQVTAMWSVVSRFGHSWDEPPSQPPGSNSRTNPANKWWDWTPDPTANFQCNSNQDLVHADYVRLHGGPAYDFWFWPDNDGLGFEGLGLYKVGYAAFGRSFDSAGVQICRATLTKVGTTNTYSVTPMAWWGGSGQPAARHKFLSAGTAWTDSYQMELRPTGEAFPP